MLCPQSLHDGVADGPLNLGPLNAEQVPGEGTDPALLPKFID